MEQGLFDAIVAAFQAMGKVTGLRYSEFNIWLYCFWYPALCGTLVWWRTRRLAMLALLHWSMVFGYWAIHPYFTQSSIRFYQANISALEWLGATTGVGYVGVSLIAGLLVPAALFLSLLLSHKRILLATHLLFLGTNLAFYLWVMSRF